MNSQPDNIHIIYLPGMQGAVIGDRWFVKGLGQAGLEHVEIDNWPKSRWPLNNLRNRDMHGMAAENLAKRVRTIHDNHSNPVVILVGHSTGAMVILDALSLIESKLVGQAWLLSAAVSATYDISPALDKLDKLINVHSAVDWIVLAAGTTLFGTADGKQTKAAGYRGFTGPGHDDPRVEQLAYDPKWLKTGHYGGHLGPLGSSFAKQIVAPKMIALCQS